MNKAGIFAGCIMLPFILSLFIPWGKSLLGLYLFKDGGTYIGVFGFTTPPVAGTAVEVWIWTWWFGMTVLNINRILIGVVFWLFPLISCVLCFSGAKKPSDKGKKYYIAAFFLLLVGIIVLIIDAMFLGALFISKIYTFAEFFGAINIGFYIYVFDMILALSSGLTYKEA